MRVLFFGSLADRLGRELHEIPVAGSVGELRRLLSARDPVSANIFLEADIRVSVDHCLASDDTAIRSGQEVAFFPVLSGG